MSDGAVLTLVAVVLALVVVGLFRLLAVLDSMDLALRRLVAGVWSARRAVEEAGKLAAAVGRDASRGQADLDRLEALKRPRSGRAGPENGGLGPVSLPSRPRPSG